MKALGASLWCADADHSLLSACQLICALLMRIAALGCLSRCCGAWSFDTACRRAFAGVSHSANLTSRGSLCSSAYWLCCVVSTGCTGVVTYLFCAGVSLQPTRRVQVGGHSRRVLRHGDRRESADRGFPSGAEIPCFGPLAERADFHGAKLAIPPQSLRCPCSYVAVKLISCLQTWSQVTPLLLTA